MERGPKCRQVKIPLTDRTRLISAHEQMKTSTREINPSREDTFVIMTYMVLYSIMCACTMIVIGFQQYFYTSMVQFIFTTFKATQIIHTEVPKNKHVTRDTAAQRLWKTQKTAEDGFDKM